MISSLMQDALQQEYYPTDRELPFEVTPQALVVLEKAYLDNETPREMLWRVAKAVAAPLQEQVTPTEWEALTYVFFNMMATRDFMPNTPTLVNAGRTLNQMAACFVVPVGDSMQSIFGEAIPSMAMIQRTGGGTGFDFSELRPEGAVVTTTNGQSSGPISFMRALNACSETIKQGGVRRGANMGVLRVDHPDIIKFIHAKDVGGVLNNFNLSVGITDEFMQAVSDDTDIDLVHNAEVYASMPARRIWGELCEQAWASGEPGVLFLDEINRKNTLPGLGPIRATNPCGEQPLLPNEACNLASINLMSCHRPTGQVDWIKLSTLSKLGTLFLDCTIDAGTYPLPIITETVKANRKIGLGVMGFADLCFSQLVPYDSPEAQKLGMDIMKIISEASHIASSSIAKVLDNFPNWQHSIYAEKGVPMRNAATTTIAPTGTIALITNASYGMEPVFALSYTKTLASGGEELVFLNEFLQSFMQDNSFHPDLQSEIMSHIIANGSLQSFNIYGRTPQKELALMKEVFITALDIEANDHVRVQAAFQTYTDNAVSKTINFSSGVSVQQISESLQLAYKTGCKGVTVYRTDCREDQPMNIKAKEVNVEVIAEESNNSLSIVKKSRPACLSGTTEQIATGCGMMLVTINKNEQGEIFEVLMKAGSTGGCAAFTDSTARLISISLRYGVPLGIIIDQLCSVKCDNYRYQVGKHGKLKGKSCSDAVGRMLKDKMKKKSLSEQLTQEDKDRIILQAITNVTGKPVKDSIAWGDSIPHEELEEEDSGVCPDCGTALYRAEGCLCCDCGYSKC